MRKLMMVLSIVCLWGSLPSFAAETSKENFGFIPDTATIKSSWQEFFKDPVYLSLSTSTRKDLTDKLFSDLIANNTAYLSWNAELQCEAKKIFYTRAGFPPEDKRGDVEGGLSAERIINYDPSGTKVAVTEKELRLGKSLVQSHENKLPSPAAEADKSLPKTEIPKSDVKKFAMPVGRSWFSSPLEDLQNDPDFIGYILIMRSKNSGNIRVE